MNIRIRVIGSNEDLKEYGISRLDDPFPIFFIEIPFHKKYLTEYPEFLNEKLFETKSGKTWVLSSFGSLSQRLSRIESRFPGEKIPQFSFLPSDRIYKIHNKNLIFSDGPLIMGILNLTPDSFSDGGLFMNISDAISHARLMEIKGAKIIDLGGESTRPGAEIVPEDIEWQRLEPVLDHYRQQKGNEVFLSVDTYKASIARQALEYGADIINDISGLTFDPEMAETLAEFNAPVVIMHIKGTPRNMQKNPQYNHLMDEILDFFDSQIDYATRKGVEQIILDPGIGFGKRLEDNFEIIRRFGEFKQFGFPVLLGLSRKSMIWRTLQISPSQADLHSVFLNTIGVLNGADIIRVHDVEHHQQLLILLKLVKNGKALNQ